MKKLLGILVLGLLLSGNANADVNEPGFAPISGGRQCSESFSKEHEKLKKIYLKSDKKKQVVFYTSCDNRGKYGLGIKKGKNLEDLHKKAYNSCLKAAKKKTPGEDCYLYSVNEEVVWKYDEAKWIAHDEAKYEAKKAKEKTELEKIIQIDKKPGRFFEDQPDVNDDHQIHFIYLLTSEGKDTELDISGWIEKRVNSVNGKFLKMSAKNKKSNGIGQQFKLDMTEEGKLDVTFVRMNISKKQLAPNFPETMVYFYLRQAGFNNPKKVYATFAGFKSKRGNSDGGEGYVPMMIIFAPAVKTYGQPNMDLVILHELFHTQAAAYGCGKRTYKGSHVKGSDILGVGELSASIDSNNNTYYRHDIEGCPDLAKSVFVTPTAEDSWDPYDVYCRQKRGNFTHPDFYRGSHGCKGGAK